MELIQGDCFKKMKEMEDNSVDTLITDPPYGLSFMGKKWDYDVPSVEIWKEALRVLKPGATALIFAGSRTQHRMAINVEDAGFILKDTIVWLYGSGFPKSLNIGKAIDKKPHADKVKEFKKWLEEQIIKCVKTSLQINKECGFTATSYKNYYSNDYWSTNLPTKEKWAKMKEVIGLDNIWDWIIENNIEKRGFIKPTGGLHGGTGYTVGKFTGKQLSDNPVSLDAKMWKGYGTAFKPAYEAIIMAMKPLDGTYAENALKWGVSGLNIDGGRIKHQSEVDRASATPQGKVIRENFSPGQGLKGKETNRPDTSKGRFPANIILDEDNVDGEEWRRYFYCAKASKSERNAGCEGLEESIGVGNYMAEANWIKDDRHKDGGYKAAPSKPQSNSHPTVKPLKLMEYLVKLTSMPNPDQVYLDPFMGSGTTGIACKNLNRNFIGIELDLEYFKIAQARINNSIKQKKLL